MALPALVVLVLVAVVAVAATGSVPRGSNESRAPSDTLLDTLFTLWIVAVVAGGILLVYGLTQRKAIAKQLALGYPRSTVASFLVFVGVLAVTVRLFSNWSPRRQETADEEAVFGGGTVAPTTPDTEPVTPYEPALSWLPIAIIGGLAAVAVIAYVVSARRSRRSRDARTQLAEELAVALDDALDDLRAEADPRRAIIAAYARLERVLAAHGFPRRAAETPDEYLVRVLGALELAPHAIGRLTALFTQAKFSHHDVDSEMKESAIDALEHVRDELRALRDESRAAEPRSEQVATT